MSGIKFETHKSPTTETFVTGNGISVTCNPWANQEGINVMIHGDGDKMPIMAAFSLRWEQLDVLFAALAAARA